MDHGNEFRGSKNGGKEEWADLKWPEKWEISGDPRWPPQPLRRPDWGSPAAARCEISPMWSSGGGAPPRPARVHCGWPESPPLVQNSIARKWFKMTQLGSTSFGELL